MSEPMAAAIELRKLRRELICCKSLGFLEHHPPMPTSVSIVSYATYAVTDKSLSSN
jgi:hypothetical protein